MATRTTGTKSTQTKTKQNNTTMKLTPYQKEQFETLKKINEFKETCEANVVTVIYKNPDLLRENDISIDEFTNNVWKVYFEIAKEIIITERKQVLDSVEIGVFLEKHPKLRTVYEEHNGFELIQSAVKYMKVENFDGYLQELKKFNAIIKLAKFGFPVSEKLSEYMDMSAEEIYQELEGLLNHVFANVDGEIKSYNALADLHELVDKLNAGEDNGLPVTATLLNKEIGGLRLGNIYGLIGGSGSGKSTVALNYILPEIIDKQERCAIFINEEDITKVRKELLLFCCQYILKTPIKKIQLRDGKFDEETLKTLHKAADWLESQDKNHNITVFPLESYSAKIVVKLIKKLKNLFGINYFILDTMKESSDSTEEAYKSMLKDSVLLYDTIKPAALNVCLFVTLQTAKSSLKNRHLRISDIGQSKSIVDVFSVAILQRRAEPDEYRGESKELKCFRIEGKSKIPFFLEEGKYYLLFFLGKNRFGDTDKYAIVSHIDLATNYFKDIGYAIVPEDW